jgi:hypothetical protein
MSDEQVESSKKRRRPTSNRLNPVAFTRMVQTYGSDYAFTKYKTIKLSSNKSAADAKEDKEDYPSPNNIAPMFDDDEEQNNNLIEMLDDDVEEKKMIENISNNNDVHHEEEYNTVANKWNPNQIIEYDSSSDIDNDYLPMIGGGARRRRNDGGDDAENDLEEEISFQEYFKEMEDKKMKSIQSNHFILKILI